MQSFVWNPGIAVSAASLGNSGVIDTHNQFDHLEATDSGWEYEPYELAGSRKRPKRRRLVPKCTSCAWAGC
jgi:NAD-dependent SIR2 family protein deacetylase